MDNREVLSFGYDLGISVRHLFLLYRNQQSLSRDDRVIDHGVELADRALGCFELEGNLSERISRLHLILFDAIKVFSNC